MKQVLLQTTLAAIKQAGACEDSYKHLLKALGGTKTDRNTPLNILTILEHNGVADALWALRLCDGHKQVDRLMAADFAEDVLPIFQQRYPNDPRPRKAIAAARKLAAAAADADAAASAYAAYAAAAYDAAAVAYDAAYAAAAYAADAATAAQKTKAYKVAHVSARQRQAEIMRRYLLEAPNA